MWVTRPNPEVVIVCDAYNGFVEAMLTKRVAGRNLLLIAQSDNRTQHTDMQSVGLKATSRQTAIEKSYQETITARMT